MSKTLNLSELKMMLTRSGYVALSSNHRIDSSEEYELFSERGRCPPVSLATLTQQTLDIIEAAPDESDAADLSDFADTLKSSLAMVESAIAKLDRG